MNDTYSLQNFKSINPYYKTMQQRLEGVPTTIVVLATEEISFGEVLLNQDTFQGD